MKRISTLALIVAAAALFVGLVYAVLQIAHAAAPAAITVHGPTLRRVWATSVVGLALLATIIGARALARPAGRFGSASARCGAVAAGVVAAINGALVLAVADGGPGTGNGVVGGAAAVVLGATAMILGLLATTRARPSRPLRASP